jgi:hypothetical protein
MGCGVVSVSVTDRLNLEIVLHTVALFGAGSTEMQRRVEVKWYERVSWCVAVMCHAKLRNQARVA